MTRSFLALLFFGVLLAPAAALACNTDEDCPEGQVCMGGICEATCEPDCAGKNCGPNGCGGECGYCAEGIDCVSGQCDCTPDCDGKDCGADGCGGLCGACNDGCSCLGGTCECCQKQCDGKECGDDGCGGQCGACQLKEICQDGACVDEGTPPVDQSGTETDVVEQPDVASAADVVAQYEVVSSADTTSSEDVEAGQDVAIAADIAVTPGSPDGTDEPEPDVVGAADAPNTEEPVSDSKKKKSGCQTGAASPSAMLLLLALAGLLVWRRTARDV